MTRTHSTKHICSQFYWQSFIHDLSQCYPAPVLISTTSEVILNRGSTVCNLQRSSQWPYPHHPMGMTNTVFIIYVCFYILVIIYIKIHSNGMFCDGKYCMIFRFRLKSFTLGSFLFIQNIVCTVIYYIFP